MSSPPLSYQEFIDQAEHDGGLPTAFADTALWLAERLEIETTHAVVGLCCARCNYDCNGPDGFDSAQCLVDQSHDAAWAWLEGRDGLD